MTRFYKQVFQTTLFLTLYFASAHVGHAQKGGNSLDSLNNLYRIAQTDSVRGKILIGLAEEWLTQNLDSLDSKARALHDIAKKLENKYYESCAISYFGISEYTKGNYSKSLDYFLNALRISEQTDHSELTIELNNELGMVYTAIDNHEKAIGYYRAAVDSVKAKGKVNINLSVYLSNVASGYSYLGDYNNSIKYAEEALKVATENGRAYHTLGALSSLSTSYDAMGDYAKALQYDLMAMDIAEKNQFSDVAQYLTMNIGNGYRHLGQYELSEQYLIKSLEMTKEFGWLLMEKETQMNLATLYEEIGDDQKALESYKIYYTLSDSLYNAESSKQIADMQTKYETEKKDSEIKLLNKDNELHVKEISKQKLIRNSTFAGLGGLAIFLVVVFMQKRKISKERDRSESLLLNILPYETAQELKEKGSADAKLFDEVTVLFTDFKGFTLVAEQLSPTELVAEIHHCFKAFDEIMAVHNIEKIKTIGDAYMAAGGLPVMNKTNAKDVIEAAFKIQAFMLNYKTQREAEGKSIFEIRIGIHTGPVVAGIVGIKKFQYDIWGDTVNTASRMESSGEAGKVNISGHTYELVKDAYACTYRGKIQAKNKGDIDMYFVENSL